jgi:predicted hydrocarbon binding protein
MLKSDEFVYNRIIEKRGRAMTTEINTTEKKPEPASASIPAFGYELIREELLPSLLGEETASILYWAGKDLARKHPLQSFDEVIDFFELAGWGTLVIRSQSKHEMEVELTSELITERVSHRENSNFQIEAGFLAQQVEYHKNVIAEAYEHPKKKSGRVHFTIKWDDKDSTDAP